MAIVLLRGKAQPHGNAADNRRPRIINSDTLSESRARTAEHALDARSVLIPARASNETFEYV
ncbi:hypothetical protein SSPSH_000094 [Salinisphaera shabanensis E1L3A]|jgi:hypothetical protein|uniref:Uncharacterized protein n=1 Tax=Salinisphaera shabanensis E1L3A TaxID=1033802 RepID=U2ERY0_9GAMM|nr:hypothetical protein SSPSH_000094 [Salinisphaera shabanensis E1L3A]